MAPATDHLRWSGTVFGRGGDAKIASWQAGVYAAKEENAELFAFTLDKSTSGFSPTTRYKDYAISERLIHWRASR